MSSLCKFIINFLNNIIFFKTKKKGMYQRIEKLRKNAFGSMCVFGENNNNQIAGVWFWKGHELAFPVSFFLFYKTKFKFYYE